MHRKRTSASEISSEASSTKDGKMGKREKWKKWMRKKKWEKKFSLSLTLWKSSSRCEIDLFWRSQPRGRRCGACVSEHTSGERERLAHIYSACANCTACGGARIDLRYILPYRVLCSLWKNDARRSIKKQNKAGEIPALNRRIKYVGRITLHLFFPSFPSIPSSFFSCHSFHSRVFILVMYIYTLQMLCPLYLVQHIHYVLVYCMGNGRAWNHRSLRCIARASARGFLYPLYSVFLFPKTLVLLHFALCTHPSKYLITLSFAHFFF